MNIPFYKYQGCGNDFVIIDDRNQSINLSTIQIKKICDRRFGIGADGLMFLSNSVSADFEMTYYNSDGNPSSFCGNGGRCITHFARKLNVVSNKYTRFIFTNQEYRAEYNSDKLISLSMANVSEIKKINDDYITNTGSPHYLYYTKGIESFDLIPYARFIRYSDQFPEGINVNLVEIIDENTIKIRTYERGVEDETLSCGTGVTAAALSLKYQLEGKHLVKVSTKGGEFKVQFEFNNNTYFNIVLTGEVEFVYSGEIIV